MEREFKRLCDLELKEGDVIEWDHRDPDNWFGPRTYTVDSEGVPRHEDRGYLSPKGNALCRVIHTNAPKLWKDMTPEEKGALLLAHHEGKVIEWYDPVEDIWLIEGYHDWDPELSFRVRPEPKVETVTVEGWVEFGKWWTGKRVPGVMHKITLTITDGEVDETAKVERI